MSAPAPDQKPEKIQLGSWCPMSCVAPLVSCYIKQLSKASCYCGKKRKPRQGDKQHCMHQAAVPFHSTAWLGCNPPAWFPGQGVARTVTCFPICASKYMEFAGDKSWGSVISVLGVSDVHVWFVSCNKSPRHTTGSVLLVCVCLSVLWGVHLMSCTCTPDLCSP